MYIYIYIYIIYIETEIEIDIHISITYLKYTKDTKKNPKEKHQNTYKSYAKLSFVASVQVLLPGPEVVGLVSVHHPRCGHPDPPYS